MQLTFSQQLDAAEAKIMGLESKLTSVKHEVTTLTPIEEKKTTHDIVAYTCCQMITSCFMKWLKIQQANLIAPGSIVNQFFHVGPANLSDIEDFQNECQHQARK